MASIKLTLDRLEIKATMDTHSAIGKRILQSLPIRARINTWGDELYFPFHLGIQLRSPVTKVNEGDIAYSNQWKALCIFYGKTPISNDTDIIANGPVEKVGVLDEDPSLLKRRLSGFFKEKKRRLANRFPPFKGFAEKIIIERS